MHNENSGSMTSVTVDLKRSPQYIVAVHGGAGYHAVADEPQLRKALKTACKRAIGNLQADYSSTVTVEKAIEVLEDDPLLNAGYGSNLTLDGGVECDAAIMDGQTGHFGSVGALSGKSYGLSFTRICDPENKNMFPGVKNPIKAAHVVLQHSRATDTLGRVPPLLLVSSGAHIFATSRGVTPVPTGSLVSPRAQQQWETWKSQLPPETGSSLAMTTHHDVAGHSSLQDTVGAIACNIQGSLSAGVSSGGLLLKHPGRVGEAAVFGAGCWAQQYPVGDIRGTACSVSGTGEDIIRCSLARTTCETLVSTDPDNIHNVLERILTEDFRNICKSRGEVEPSAGILLLVEEEREDGSRILRLWCAFTTQSMAVAYASSVNPKPKALVLRRPRQTTHGNTGPPIYITTLPW